MDETEWSATDRALYVAGVPLLALALVLILFAAATASSRNASAALPAPVDMSPSAVAERAQQAALRKWRETYQDCLSQMGVDTSPFAGRFSRPSRDRVRTATGVCSTLLQGGRAAGPSGPRRAAVPNTL
jgi:hypothetical protein